MRSIFRSTQRSRRHRPLHQETQPEAPAAFFQPKLTINQPGDPYEREADAVADAVVNQSNKPAASQGQTGVQRMPISSVQRLATPDEEKMPATNDERMAEDKRIQEKPEDGRGWTGDGGRIQKMDAPKEEEKTVQAKEEEEPVQKAEMKEEEPVQAKEEEEPVQKAEMKEEEPVQAKEEEEPVQKAEMKEEEPVQAKEEEEPVQAKSQPGAAKPAIDFSARITARRGQGEPLPAKARAQMEQGIGADFSQVRIHTDSEAVKMSKNIHAQAFTTGRDVYFNAGKFDPASTEGKRLLAHELTHVVQQGGGKQSQVVHRKNLASQNLESQLERRKWGNVQTTERNLSDGRRQKINTIPFSHLISRKNTPMAENESNFIQQEKPILVETILPTEETLSSSLDKISPTITHKATVSRGGSTPSGFGVTNSAFKFENVIITPGIGTFKVTGDLKHTITWQVRSGKGPSNQVSIVNEKDPNITAKNYPTVYSDLTPDMSDLNGRPPRTAFWAEDLTIKHERYHAENQRKASYGPQSTTAIQKWIGGQTASSADDITKKILPLAMNEGIKVFNLFVASSKDEEDAYGDGAASYKSRADAIKTKGDKGEY